MRYLEVHFREVVERLREKAQAVMLLGPPHDTTPLAKKLRGALLGPSLPIPFVGGELVLGEWQQVVLVELDIRPRTRKVVVQVIGE